MRPSLLALLLLGAPPSLAYADEAPELSPAPLVPPELLEVVEPAWPAELSGRELSARVRLEVSIDTAGEVAEVVLLEVIVEAEGVDPRPFGREALAAATRLRFAPARQGDEAVAVRIAYSYRFEWVAPEPEPEPSTAPEVASAEVPLQLFERGTRKPLAGIEVRARAREGDFKAEGITDEEGRLTLALPAGDHRLEVDDLALQLSELLVRVPANAASIKLTVWRIPRRSYGDTIVVTGRRERTTGSRITLQAEELRRIPGTFGDPFRVVQVLPGVARAPFSSGQIIVRGAEPESTGFFIDGHPVPILYHFGAGPQVIAPSLVESLDFYPGGYSARYGRFTAGLVDVHIADAPRDRPHGHVDVDFFDAGAVASVPLDDERAGLTFGLRRSYLDGILALALPGDTRVLPRYWDYQTRGDYRFDDGSKVSLFLFGSDDRLVVENEAQGDEDPASNVRVNAGIGFHRGLLTAKPALPEPFSLNLSWSGGRDALDFSLGDLEADVFQWTTLVRADAKAELHERAVLSFGGDFNYLRFTGDLRAPPLVLQPFPAPFRDSAPPASFDNLLGYEVSEDQNALGLYAEAVLSPFERLKIIPGLRWDLLTYGDTSRGAFDPRLTLRFEILKKTLTVKGSVGRYHQPPDFISAGEDIGNPGLDPTWSVNSMVGIEYWPTDYLDFELMAFFNRTYDIPVQSDVILVQDGQTRLEGFRSEGEGRAYGLEVFVRHRFHDGFFGWLAYTLSRAERRVPGGDWQLFTFDQTHILNLATSYRFFAVWQIGARLQLVSGNPVTPIVGSDFDADTGFHLPRYGDPFSSRQPLFVQFDARLDYRFVFDEWILTAFLEVLNVLNRSNTEFTLYSYDYRESGPLPGIPLLPLIGVEADF